MINANLFIKTHIGIGTIALLCSIFSFGLHELYGSLHWASRGISPHILDAFHLGSSLVAICAFIISIIYIAKRGWILGVISLSLSIYAFINSLVCY
jgi:hypothetical protein